MSQSRTLTDPPGFFERVRIQRHRPDYERPYLLIPVGYPADDCVVPDIQRKPLDQIMVVDRPAE